MKVLIVLSTKIIKVHVKYLLAFESAIIKLIELFNTKEPYQEYNFPLSRAIAYYVSTYDINWLLSNDIINEIYKEYQEYLNVKRIKIKKLDSENINFFYNKNIKKNDYSSNY